MFLDVDHTFELARQRQEYLRLLAGPQPFIPLTDPPFGAVRRFLRRWIGRLDMVAEARHVTEPNVRVTP